MIVATAGLVAFSIYFYMQKISLYIENSNSIYSTQSAGTLKLTASSFSGVLRANSGGIKSCGGNPDYYLEFDTPLRLSTSQNNIPSTYVILSFKENPAFLARNIGKRVLVKGNLEQGCDYRGMLVLNYIETL